MTVVFASSFLDTVLNVLNECLLAVILSTVFISEPLYFFFHSFCEALCNCFEEHTIHGLLLFYYFYFMKNVMHLAG